MANRFWVGGNATWDGTAGTKWATTSGGAGGAAVPTAADDVFLDNGAGTGNVTLSASSVCRSLNCTGYVNTLTHPAATTITIGDATAGASNIALKLVAGSTYTLGNATTSAISFISTSATQQTIDYAGKTTGNVTFNGAGGSWIYSSGHTTGATTAVTHTAGTLNINGQTCSWGNFSSTTGTRSLTLGNASITVAVAGTSWNLDGAGLTFNSGNTTLYVTGSGADVCPAPSGGSWNVGSSIIISGSGGHDIYATNWTLGNLTITGTANKGDSVIINGGGTNTIAGTLTINGNSATNRILVLSSVVGTARTLTAATVSVTNTDFQDITGAGAGSWDLSAISGGSGDCGGNSGITFTTPATQTWNGTSGGNWSANAWSGRVPLPQDDVVINAAFSGGQTVTADMPRLGASIDWTGATGAPTWAYSTGVNIYGSLTMISGMTFSTSGNSVTFTGRSSYTVLSAGNTFGSNFSISAPNGTYTLSDAILVTGNFIVNYGTFTSADQTITCNAFTSSNSNTRTLNMGSSQINLMGTSSGDIYIMNGFGITFTGAPSITYANASANSRNFKGNGYTYGTLTYTVAGSTGTLVVTGSNTFNTINFSDASNARTLQFTAGTTTTITGSFNVFGTSGKLMSVQSATAATHTLSRASGNVSTVDYVNLTNSIATGGAGWYAGANSTDSGGNTGWIFTAAPNNTGGNSNTASLSIASLARL